MQTKLSLVGAVLITGLLAVGCAGPEQKLGRGMNNSFEIIRMGEMRRTVEQTALFDSPDSAYTTGFVRGFNRSMARTGIGLWEIVSSPFPNHRDKDYGPICTKYLKPAAPYPDNYKPRLMADSMFATDTAIGFSGGDVAPLIPGSRFRIFDN